MQTATNAKDLKSIRTALRNVEKNKFASRLTKEVKNAKKMIKSLERMASLDEAVLKLDQRRMLELRNYANPPKLVYHVIQATLLLLGDEEQLTKVCILIFGIPT